MSMNHKTGYQGESGKTLASPKTEGSADSRKKNGGNKAVTGDGRKKNSGNKAVTGDGRKKTSVKMSALPDLPEHWYYMCSDVITVSEIRDVLDPVEYDIEIWKEAGVLEIGVGDKSSVDMEECECDLGDEYSNDFLEQHGVKSLFYVTIGLSQAGRCRDVLKKIVNGLGGMFCADTDDFEPIIR